MTNYDAPEAHIQMTPEQMSRSRGIWAAKPNKPLRHTHRVLHHLIGA